MPDNEEKIKTIYDDDGGITCEITLSAKRILETLADYIKRKEGK